MFATRSKILLLSLLLSAAVFGQGIPVSRDYERVYDFVDELIVDGVISRQQIVQPYTRLQIAQMLTEAATKDSLLNTRQQKDLKFYLNVFALERDTMVNNYVQYTDHRTFNLSLGNPQFSFMTKNKLFKMSIEPILGMDIYGGKKGAIFKRWYGAEIRMDIVRHISIWGSLRDVSYNGKWALRNKYYPDAYAKIDGAKITKPEYLNDFSGVQYKEADYGGDFSDSRGGVSVYAWFGSIGFQRESIKWGDSYHASNILSGHNPAVPMLTLQLTPCKWFRFDYFHAWLVSNVIDSTYYYVEDATGGVKEREYRPMSKFMAANMFTFTPVKYLSFGFGNSIVYAERTVQGQYFIPFAFFKSLDHLFTKGTGTENQNSQAFASISLYPCEHLKLYASFYLDEFSINRWKKSNPQHNPVSYLVGFNWSGWPVKGLSLKGEFMRSYIACYTHSIDALTWTSNSYNMGHYLGDNAQSIFVEASYRPIRGMIVKLSFTHDTKYNSYPYLRVHRENGQKVEPENGISSVISQKPFANKIFTNMELKASCVYEVLPNLYVRASLMYNNAQGYDRLTGTIPCELTGTAQQMLSRYAPIFFQGRNITAVVGASLSF